MVKSQTHPDLTVLATERVVISIDEVRSLVASSQFGGSMGRFRIMIIEDADRMAERSSNVLLKALEEPPGGTVWILCAPSEADMLPTIRSRVRRVGLKVPSVEDVASLLVERDDIDPQLAAQSAAEAQSHIGMARRLATSQDARVRRRDSLTIALDIDSVTAAVNAADRWLEVAKKDADALTSERDEQEREELLRVMGVEPGTTVPTNLRPELKNLEESQKRRATRSLRDAIDRILIDLISLFRDVLTIQLSAQTALVNEQFRARIEEVAKNSTAAQSIAKIEFMNQARERIDANVRDLLVLESVAVTIRNRAKSSGCYHGGRHFQA